MAGDDRSVEISWNAMATRLRRCRPAVASMDRPVSVAYRRPATPYGRRRRRHVLQPRAACAAPWGRWFQSEQLLVLDALYKYTPRVHKSAAAAITVLAIQCTMWLLTCSCNFLCCLDVFGATFSHGLMSEQRTG